MPDAGRSRTTGSRSIRPFASRKSLTSFTGTAKPAPELVASRRELHPHDTHHVAFLVEHRTAAVAGLDHRVRLQEGVSPSSSCRVADSDPAVTLTCGITSASAGFATSASTAAEREAQHLDRPPGSVASESPSGR